MIKTINVTQLNISHGVRHSYNECPVARAIRLSFETEPDIGVYLDEIVINDLIIPTPIPVKQFVFDFDAGNPVQPFSFQLEV